jgi:hypothetical protein
MAIFARISAQPRFHVIDYIYSYCKISKDDRGIYENQKSLGSDVFVYSDTNTVDWNNFKK